MPTRLVGQFKVTLQDVDPPVWRRIQVPANYTFWDLHVAIQDAMGWHDSHLHSFKVRIRKGPSVVIGIPDEDYESGRETLPGWDIPLARYLTRNGQKAMYEYDFGDGWEHELVFEGVVPLGPALQCPRCIDGARACPPEDCGGPHGYARLLEALHDPNHPSRAELMDWVGGAFDPEAFHPSKVEFDDPEERWRIAFAE